MKHTYESLLKVSLWKYSDLNSVWSMDHLEHFGHKKSMTSRDLCMTSSAIMWHQVISCDVMSSNYPRKVMWFNMNQWKRFKAGWEILPPPHFSKRRRAIFVNLPSNGNGDRASKFWRFGFNFENGFHDQSKSFRMIHDFHAVLKLIFLTGFELVWTGLNWLREIAWIEMNEIECSWIFLNFGQSWISGLNPWILGFLGFTHFRLEQH